MKLKLVHNPSFKKYFKAGLGAFVSNKEKLQQHISSKILSQLFDDKGQLSFFKSGRSALYAALKQYKADGYLHVFIPYRVCNLITIAARQVGLTVHYYSLDKLQKFQQGTFNDPGKSVVITVSIWGREFNTGAYLQFIRASFSNTPPIIVDECQNLLINSSLEHAALRSEDVVIFSFNDKTIPGFMGGLAWSFSRSFASTVLSAKEELMMMLYYLSDLKNIAKSKQGFKGEYSTCKGLRYGIDDKGMSKVSLAVNATMIRHWSEIEALRIRNYQLLNNQDSLFKIHPDNQLTPYIPIDTAVQLNGGMALKGPYLINQEETVAEAVADGGHVCAINSFRYKIMSNEQR